MNGFGPNQIGINPSEHRICQCWIGNKLVAIVAIFIVLMQVNIVKTGTGIENRVINDRTFQVKNTQRFTGIHRNAVNGDRDILMLVGHLTVPVCVSSRGRGTNAATLRAMPVYQNTDIERGTSAFSGIERRKDSLTTLIIFQIQGYDADTLCCRCDFFQQCLAKIRRRVQRGEISN